MFREAIKRKRKTGLVFKPSKVSKSNAKKVNRILAGIEKKTHSYPSTAIQYVYDGSFVPLSLISEGSTSHTREGLTINPKWLNIRGFNTFSAATGYTSFPVRLIIVQDKEQRGTVPVIGDVLNSPDIQSQYNHLSINRFKILVDQVFQNRSPTSDVSNYQSVIINKKLSGKIHYLTANANQAGQGKNNIYMYCLSNINTAGTPSYFTLTARLTYTDM